MGCSNYDIFSYLGSGHFNIKRTNSGGFQIEKRFYDTWKPFVQDGITLAFPSSEEAQMVVKKIYNALWMYRANNDERYIHELSQDLSTLIVTGNQERFKPKSNLQKKAQSKRKYRHQLSNEERKGVQQ